MIVAYSLAEMAVIHPVAGSFGVYAETYLSSWAGFAVRATYGLVQVIAIGAEVTAVAIYFGFWFPQVPQWFWVVSASICLVAINSLQVGRFGEFQYWCALIKVTAILLFIAVGAALIFGIGPRPALGLSNLVAHGGFMPYGMKGVWLALTLVLTSYMGVEIVAVTAGEAQDAHHCIPSYFLLCPRDHRHACDDPVGSDWERNRNHREPICQGLFRSRNPIRRDYHEPGRDHRGALQLQ
jgi:L-asparagine transporter-like permease